MTSSAAVLGFQPAPGTSFDVLNFAAVQGEFDQIVLPALGSGLAWDVSALYHEGTLSVVPEPATLALLGGALVLILAANPKRN